VGSAIWGGIKTGADAVGDFLAGLGIKIWDGLWTGIKGLGNWLYDAGKQIWEGLKSVFSFGFFSSGGTVTNGGPKTAAGYQDYGSVGSFGTSFNLSNGGTINGRAKVSGDSRVNDTVPAMLSPGEIVIPRSAVDQGFRGAVDFLAGQFGASSPANNLPALLSFARDAIGTSPLRMASGGVVPGNAFPSMNTANLESRLVSLESTMREIGFALAKTSLRTSNLLSEWEVNGLPETRTI
jgi:hypothetical protein